MAIREIGGGGYPPRPPSREGKVPTPAEVSEQVGKNPVVGSEVASVVDLSESAKRALAKQAAERARSEKIEEELAEEAEKVPDAKEGSGSGPEDPKQEHGESSNGGKRKGVSGYEDNERTVGRGKIISTEA